MRHMVYRICLLSVVIIAIVGGIFYYLNYVRDEADITEGTLVRQEQSVDTASSSEPEAGQEKEEKQGALRGGRL